jgi:hypothetical protein
MVILLVGGALGGWALLAVMGAERERLRADVEVKRPAAAAKAGTFLQKPTPLKPPPPPRAAPEPARVEKNVR